GASVGALISSTSVHHGFTGMRCESTLSGGCNFISNVVYGTIDAGIVAAKFTSINVASNTVMGAVNEGLYLQSGNTAGQATGNTVFLISGTGVIDSAQGVTIASNTVYNNTQVGIQVTNANNTVSNNLVYGNTQQGIALNSGANETE